MNGRPLYYAGFGLLADRKFVKELLGRRINRSEFEEVIYGYRLKTIDWEDLPKAVQRETRPGFRIYGLTEDQEGRGRVKILMLMLSPQEIEAVRALNFGKELFHLQIGSYPVNTEMAGWSINLRDLISIDLLKDPSLGRETDGMTYPYYLNGEQEAMETARQIRGAFIGPRPEGQRLPSKER